MDPHNESAPFSKVAERYWAPVDLYIGGASHAVLHLLYARFWHKVFFDLGLVSTSEPFRRLFNQGMLTAPAYKDRSGRRVPADEVVQREGSWVRQSTGEEVVQFTAQMAKSLRNVINPDHVIAEHGADAFRLYEMFMAPLADSRTWDPRGIAGCRRFLERLWKLFVDPEAEEPVRGELLDTCDASASSRERLELERALNAAIRRVDDSFEHFNFNTAIAAMMTFVNEAHKRPGALPRDQAERLLGVVSPFAPTLATARPRALDLVGGLARGRRGLSRGRGVRAGGAGAGQNPRPRAGAARGFRAGADVAGAPDRRAISGRPRGRPYDRRSRPTREFRDSMNEPVNRIAKLCLVLALCATATAGPYALAAKKKQQQPSDEHTPVRCYDVDVRGETAFLAQTLGLSVWDVADPLRPQATERLALPTTVYGVAAEPPRLYLAGGGHGLYVAELDEEGAPQLVSRFNTPGSVRQVVRLEHYALLADDRHGLLVVDISDATRPLQKARVSTRDKMLSLALQGTLLATAEKSAGVRLFDLSRPERPLELDVIRELRDARDVAFVDGLLVVAGGQAGLFVYRLDDQGRTSRVGSLEIARSANHVAGDEGVVLVSNGTPALQLIRLDAAGRPTLLEPLRVHRFAPVWRIHVRGERAYAAIDEAGISIIDLKDPDMPEVLLPRTRRFEIGYPGLESDDER
jgi:hypothetical protein